MSLSAHGDDKGAGLAQVPRLAQGAGAYAAWRPQMENALLRAGIAERDYKEKNDDWPALVAAVDSWVRADERASIEFALGRLSASAAKSSGAAGPTAAEKEARRGVVEMVTRTKKAYALLFHALSDELRRLVASVPQGDANGLWSWLESRFQSTEQDNVGDLWDQFTKMEQEDDECFDRYKARVDHVYSLLAHAKDKPSPGLYTHRLLWKLRPKYTPAVLALKASGKLSEPQKIVWDEIASFINNHERSEQRLNGRDDDNVQGHLTMAATDGARRTASTNQAPAAAGQGGDFVCFNCGGKGHIARHCSKPRRGRRGEKRGTEAGAKVTEQASTLLRTGAYTSDEEEGNGEQMY